MTPECGRCGSKSNAHVNGVGRQCLMCGQEHGQAAQDAAFVAGVDAEAQDQVKDARVMNVRSASRALQISYTTLLQWVHLGALPATPYDPRRPRRGRLVRIVDIRELINEKTLVVCLECGSTTRRTFLPGGVRRLFCPPPARCSSQWHERHRARRAEHNDDGLHNCGRSGEGGGGGGPGE